MNDDCQIKNPETGQLEPVTEAQYNAWREYRKLGAGLAIAYRFAKRIK